ncbi:hypothetical protein [Kutzneria chonburiensis]|uniref:WXG100 family type VII secretion target n=1 Tax=Kutzneria chonburiensis TaxID=1483604 RepID=A0ABV6N0R1_9PSEU|nr:hypothetical protein [Kutzneria chonburiensis]
MADDKVSVNTEGMAPAVDGFKSLGDRLVQITSKLEHTLDSLGTPWGNDKNGHAFFKQYGTARDQTLTGVTDMADVVHSVGEGVRQMIDAYEKVEEHNQELARKMQLRREGGGDGGGGGGGGGGGSYGGGGGGGGGNGPGNTKNLSVTGDDKKVPLERATRRELTRQTPAEPLQPALRREAERIPATGENGEPLEPLRPALREELKPAIPSKPVLATSRDGVPLEPTERHDLLPRTAEVPARPVEDVSIPAEKGKFVKSVPAEPAEFIPTTPGVPAEGRFAAAIPAERGEFVPQTPGVPLTDAKWSAAEPGTPMGHLLPREGEALLPAEKGIPAEPLHRADGIATPPSHVHAPHATSRFVTEPAPGEVTLPRHEGVPGEPLHRADGVATPPSHVNAPHPTARFAPGEATSPRHRSEPVGFAELEPEIFLPAEPAIPAEPEK